MYLNHSILRAVCLVSRRQFFPSLFLSLSCVDSKWDVFFSSQPQGYLGNREERNVLGGRVKEA